MHPRPPCDGFSSPQKGDLSAHENGGKPGARLRRLLRLHCTPEHDVVPQPRDFARSELADDALAKPLTLLVGEGIDGGAVARAEHDVPEAVRPFELVALAGARLDVRADDPTAREQFGERRRRRDRVPWV